MQQGLSEDGDQKRSTLQYIQLSPTMVAMPSLHTRTLNYCLHRVLQFPFALCSLTHLLALPFRWGLELQRLVGFSTTAFHEEFLEVFCLRFCVCQLHPYHLEDARTHIANPADDLLSSDFTCAWLLELAWLEIPALACLRNFANLHVVLQAIFLLMVD